jgi:gliding motility-associated-like protein
MKQVNLRLVNAFTVLSVLFLSFSSINLSAQCDQPFPKGDIDTTLRNVPKTIDVANNDITYFGSGQPLTSDSLVIVTPPSHGTVTVLNDTEVVYTPTPGFTGLDQFTYRIYNACGNSGIANVYVYVKPYCPAPSAFDDAYSVYNNILTSLNVTSNDVNIAGGPLAVTVLSGPSHGKAVVSSGKINFTGDSVYVGLDTLTYVVCDTCPAGKNCDTAQVVLDERHCDAVKTATDEAFVIQQDTITVNVLANDTNTSGFGTTTVTLVNTPKYGTATVVGNQVNYIASGTAFGIDSVKYLVKTDCGSSTGWLVIQVDQRPCGKPTGYADLEYAGYSSLCSNTFNVLMNDFNPINSGALTITNVSTPQYGTATVVGNKVVYICTDSTKVGLQDFFYYKVNNLCGSDSVRVDVTITPNKCNGIKPTIVPDNGSLCRNDSLIINVIANDYDPEGGVITLSDSLGNGVIGLPAHGKVVRLSLTTYLYIPDTNYFGTDFFVYQAGDNGTPRLYDQNRVDITVNQCANPPVIVDNKGKSIDTVYVTYPEDSSASYCFNYTDADGDFVSVSTPILTSPAQLAPIETITPIKGSQNLGVTPCIGMVPPKDYNGKEQVWVTICDEYPLCDSVLVIITVTPKNDPPVAVRDVVNYAWEGCQNTNVLANDFDIDKGDKFTITAFDTTTVNGGTISKTADSVLCYTPNSAFSGVDSFAYTICDTSKTCSTAYVIVNVPFIARNDSRTINQEETIVINVRENDSNDPRLGVSKCSEPLHGTATVNGDGTITYVAADDYPYDPISNNTIGIGQDSFCYQICFSGGQVTLCQSATVYITINPKPKFYIPQGFSPGADGVNDKFFIVSAEEYPKSQLLVYNRYGDEVWRNDGEGYQNDFDGTFKKNNEALPDGSYYYIYKFNDGVQKDAVGYIVIQR